MSLRLKLVALGILGVAVVSGYLAWQHHERQLGAAKVEARDARLAQAAAEKALEQVKHDAEINADAVAQLQSERDRLDRDVADHPVPVIRVCNPGGSGGLSATAGATGGAREATAEGGQRAGVPRGDQPGNDIGPGVQLLALGIEQLSAQLRAIQQRERGL